MKKLILALLTTLCLLTSAFANEPKLPTPESELACCHAYLESPKVSADAANYLRFFTTYGIPETWKNLKGDEVKLRQYAELSMPFIFNSVCNYKADKRIAHPKRVPGSNTLWWVDIRDYGWSIHDVDAVFALQPYFLNPVVDKPGNILFRADWFLVNVMDTAFQEDRGIKDIPYYILTYGKGSEPKNADDFRKAWHVDIDTIREEQIETGTVVNSGDSGVSKHTRQLRRGRTPYGAYHETRDVKSHDLDPDKLKSRDYVEDVFANQFDAGEYITNNKRGLQTYLLTAGKKDKFKRIEIADTGIVVDRQDHEDPRVRTAIGCMNCHAVGIIPATNAIRDLYRQGGDLRFKTYELKRQVEAFYLSDLNSEVEDDNRIFARAVKECNGLDPFENAKTYRQVFEWYRGKVDVKQAAVECGMELEQYKKVIEKATSGRLVFLFGGTAMPREIWDSYNLEVGGYIQSMLLYKGKDVYQKPKKLVQDEGFKEFKVTVTKPDTLVYGEHNAPLYRLGKGYQLTVLKVYDSGWYWVKGEDFEGFVDQDFTALVR